MSATHGASGDELLDHVCGVASSSCLLWASWSWYVKDEKRSGSTLRLKEFLP